VTDCYGAPDLVPLAAILVSPGRRRPITPNRTMTKNQAISALILAEVAKGKTIQQAFDAVIGEGSYEQLAGEIWEALQPRA